MKDPHAENLLDRLQAAKDIGPLADAKIGGHGTVAYLGTQDGRVVQKLMALGIMPGMRIRLLRRFPSFVFQMSYSQFTVDRELAEKIYVHWQK